MIKDKGNREHLSSIQSFVEQRMGVSESVMRTDTSE